MAYTNPTVQQFKDRFFRDFPYGTDMNTSVLDIDIENAMDMTDVNINQALFSSQAFYTQGYLLLTAHYLVTNLRASSQGKDGQYNWIEQSKGVGSLSTSYAIPDQVKNNPYWSMIVKTNYGAEYLQLLLPQLVGPVMFVRGSTRP